MRRMDEVVIRDLSGWLTQEGFLKANNLRFIDGVDSRANFYGSRNHGYSSGIMKERKLTSCDNGRIGVYGIKRGGGIISRCYRSKGSIWTGRILDRGIM